MSRTQAQPFAHFRLSDAPVVRLANAASFAVLVCLGALLAWMVLTPVDEIAKARGAIEPESEVQRIQAEYGGAVVEIAVREGQEVRAGDVLVRFDGADVSSEIRETRLQELSLLLEQERLTAVVEDRPPDFDRIAKTVLDQTAEAANAETLPVHSVLQILAREQATTEAQRATLENQRQAIRREITAKQAELAAIDAERPSLERQLRVAREQVSMQETLIDQGLARRPEFVSAMETEAGFDYELATLTGREAVLEAELLGLRDRLSAVDLSQAAEARARIAEIDQTFLQIEEQIARLVRRSDAGEVRAPVSGLVQTLPDTVVGRVIEPGGLVAEIVPQDVALRFAAELAPRDVGFVQPGQDVRLKIDAYEFGRFGALDGTVAEVSPTTILNEQGVAHYEVLIDIPKPYFRDDPAQFRLLPGMTGEVDILTGKKTVFAYVWKPIYTNLDLALTER